MVDQASANSEVGMREELQGDTIDIVVCTPPLHTRVQAG